MPAEAMAAQEPPALDEAKPTRANSMPAITRLATQLKGNRSKVKVLGYARASDEDGAGKSLERANAIRDQLLENGVRPEQVEVVATGQIANGDGVRILAADGDGPKPVQGKSATEASTDPRRSGLLLPYPAGRSPVPARGRARYSWVR